ncbi:MAG TPA: sigma 54-interacting transcriptional regulator [Chitinispirillaceae bacterium]|nr:sigma 54-interacting transcriptional regulator [Chitinispirillaceae bacterium]
MNNNGTIPSLVRQSDNFVHQLYDRLTTIGSSPQCKIIIAGANFPAHIAHIIFSAGTYSITAISRTPPVYLNGVQLLKQFALNDGDSIEIAGEVWKFSNGFSDGCSESRDELSPMRRFIGALSRFSRTGDSDARFELLAGVAQLIGSDGARLVVEEEPDNFTTIARYPQSSGLDRFSQRAIIWAKQQGVTVLMQDTDWESSRDSKGSLELNRIGSVLCRPIYEGNVARGYLYLDRQLDKSAFTENERLLLDDVGPVFGDLLVLYEKSNRQQETIARLQENLKCHDTSIIFDCEAMRQAIELALKFASTDSTVLLNGETGTGKELFARFIHQHSNRAQKDFCAINCGALPENLIESELFGHEKGAFTGAHQRKKGLFERAQGGTVFLDEIGEMPLNLQVKLLRVLQEAEIVPLGSTATLKVDVRVIAATNKDLWQQVRNGNFREDLFYRLNVLAVSVPPLRQRHRDVLLLADFFMKKYTARFGIPEKMLSLSAQAKLLKHCWPGNIRQLENVLQKALLISKGSMILDTDLELPEIAGCDSEEKRSETSDNEHLTLKDAKAAAEKRCVQDALLRANGNITIAARLLDTDRKWLTKLMKIHGVSATNTNTK